MGRISRSEVGVVLGVIQRFCHETPLRFASQVWFELGLIEQFDVVNSRSHTSMKARTQSKTPPVRTHFMLGL